MMFHSLFRVSANQLLRQSIRFQPPRCGIYRATSCVLSIKQLSASFVYQDDDKLDLPKNVLDANMPESYAKFNVKLDLKKKELLKSPNRFQKIGEREERSDITPLISRKFSIGKSLLQHHGVPSVTGPLDIVIYDQLFDLIQPQTVFELGSLCGGSALWIANTLRMQGSKGHVYSIDLDLSLLDPRVRELKPDNLTFIQGDMYKIEEVLPRMTLERLPHPWVVIEDAHANSFGVLEYFHQFMKEGDYIVYDDTDPETPIKTGMGLVVDCDMPYKTCGLDKLNTLKKFMTKYNDFYSVDSYLTDLFGYNATNNWNGYIRRMK